MKINPPKLTIERLQAVLDYNPFTGEFIWRRRADWRQNENTRYAGQIAGRVSTTHGYREICIDYVLYKASRLAWFYMTGFWPDLLVDHENTVKSDDWLANLRLATFSENGANCGPRERNTSGLKGISWDKGKSKWRVRIKKNYRDISIGYFDDLTVAAQAYLSASKEHHKEFARP